MRRAFSINVVCTRFEVLAAVMFHCVLRSTFNGVSGEDDSCSAFDMAENVYSEMRRIPLEDTKSRAVLTHV